MAKIITLDEGLMIVEEGIARAKLILDGYHPKTLFTAEDIMNLYDCVYNMCVQNCPHNYSMQLYERFKRALEESISSRVLPSLVDKCDMRLLVELLQMWENYKVMAKCLSGFFLYLDRHFAINHKVAPLNDVSFLCFCDRVCNELYLKFRDSAISLIHQERDGKPIDLDLLKNVVAFFVEIGGQENACYYDDFTQVKWCWAQERGRASHCLYQTTVDELPRVVTMQLMNMRKLIEKHNTESHDLAMNYCLDAPAGALEIEALQCHCQLQA